MGLEAGTFISDLVVTNPVGSDLESQGDDHLRLLKTLIKASFPTSSKAWYNPTTVTKSADYTVLATDMNKTILVDTTAGVVTLTMPTLVSGDAGWTCSILKTNTGTNPCLIAPPSGTIQSGAVSGLTKTRRCIPGVPSRVLWTGSAWIAERATQAPIGTILDFSGSSLPVGYEWPNGQTLASASTNYPDYNSVIGSGITSDLCGRVVAGKDDMGEASNNRLTVAGSGIDGDTLGAAGGAETVTLDTTMIPAHSHTNTLTDPGHNHTTTAQVLSGGGGAVASGSGIVAATAAVNSNTTGITITNVNAGGGLAHANVQPTIVLNKILVVE